MKARIFSQAFWVAAAERALHTVAQSALGLIPVTAISLGDVPWVMVASGAALAGVVSIIKSVSIGVPEVEA